MAAVTVITSGVDPAPKQENINGNTNNVANNAFFKFLFIVIFIIYFLSFQIGS